MDPVSHVALAYNLACLRRDPFRGSGAGSGRRAGRALARRRRLAATARLGSLHGRASGWNPRLGRGAGVRGFGSRADAAFCPRRTISAAPRRGRSRDRQPHRVRSVLRGHDSAALADQHRALQQPWDVCHGGPLGRPRVHRGNHHDLVAAGANRSDCPNLRRCPAAVRRVSRRCRGTKRSQSLSATFRGRATCSCFQSGAR